MSEGKNGGGSDGKIGLPSAGIYIEGDFLVQRGKNDRVVTAKVPLETIRKAGSRSRIDGAGLILGALFLVLGFYLQRRLETAAWGWLAFAFCLVIATIGFLGMFGRRIEIECQHGKLEFDLRGGGPESEGFVTTLLRLADERRRAIREEKIQV